MYFYWTSSTWCSQPSAEVEIFKEISMKSFLTEQNVDKKHYNDPNFANTCLYSPIVHSFYLSLCSQ